MAIMEVIQKKERKQPDYQPLDTEKAWAEFQSFYNTEEGRKYSIYSSNGKNLSPQQNSSAHAFKQSKRIRNCFLAAIVIMLLIAVTCIPVLGYNNIVQMVAYWTAEQFGFQTADNIQSGSLTRQSNQQLPEEYQELQTALEERGIELLVPEFPEGFEADKPFLYVDPTTENVEFSIIYTQNEDYISFDITQNGGIPLQRYEKDNSSVEEYEYSNTTHYIFDNNGIIIVAWITDDLEYCICTTSAFIDIKEVIQSMY